MMMKTIVKDREIKVNAAAWLKINHKRKLMQLYAKECKSNANHCMKMLIEIVHHTQ